MTPPASFNWMGTQYKILTRGAETNGAVGQFESLDAPGYGPPKHIHHDADETFYVLGGEILFWQQGQTRIVGPGEVVFIPRGQEHTFQVTGAHPARMLTTMTPGGFEDFFEAMVENRCLLPQDMAKAAEIGAGFKLEFTGPPLSAAH